MTGRATQCRHSGTPIGAASGFRIPSSSKIRRPGRHFPIYRVLAGAAGGRFPRSAESPYLAMRGVTVDASEVPLMTRPGTSFAPPPPTAAWQHVGARTGFEIATQAPAAFVRAPDLQL